MILISGNLILFMKEVSKSNMKNKIISLVASLVIAVGLFAVAGTNPTPAAATVYWNCDSGHACMWQHINGGGAKWDIPFSSPTYGGLNVCHNLPPTWKNIISSVSDDIGSGYKLRFYGTPDCGNYSWEDVDNEAVNFTGIFWSIWNDDIESYKIIP